MSDHSETSPIEIRAERLGKSFGEREVLRGIDLTVRAGEIVCIVGASGSGKTVLLDHLVALMSPTSGRVLAADHNPAPDASGAPVLKDLNAITEDELDLVRLHWAVVFQRNALFSGTVKENLALWLREHTTLDEPTIDERTRASLASVALDVSDVLDKDRDALSGGMAKRVAIARAIACDPILLFYDEPTTGLDPMIAATVHELIFRTHHQPLGPGFAFKDLDGARPAGRDAARRTTIIVTHDRELLRRMRPRIVMIHEGSVCFDGTFEAFARSDLPPAQAYLTQMPVLHARETRW